MKHETPERSVDSLKTLCSKVEVEPFDATAPFTFSLKEKLMTVNFESLAQAEKSQAAQDYENYQNLLRDIAAGKDRDENDILEICRRVDRNVGMLENDVKWRKDRDAMIAKVRMEEEYKAKQEEADMEWSRLNAEFKKIEAEYDEKRSPHRSMWYWTRERLQEIMIYRSELERNCRDQNIFDELEALSEQKNWRRIDHLKEKCKEIQRKIMFAQQELDELPALMHGRKEKKLEIKARIKDLQVRYESHMTEIAELQRKDAETAVREAELREAKVFA